MKTIAVRYSNRLEMVIVSSRGRVIRELAERQRLLEEQFQVTSPPLSKEEQDRVGRVFDTIRRTLDKIGGPTCLTQ